MVFLSIPTSEAELYELIIDLSIQKGAIYSGETLTVTGKVLDHAYKPMSDVEILILAGAETGKTFTNSEGEFTKDFENFERVPGTYTINVIGSLYEMTGLTSAQFQIKGDASQVSALEEKLSTEEAERYLSADQSDFEGNPIGQALFKYYQGLLDELVLEEKENNTPIAGQVYLEEQRKIAEDLKSQAIELFNPSAGTYEGYQYDSYIDNLNPEIKDLVTSQLNFTKNTVNEAQKLRDEIIANGGTYEEARQAYLDMISIPKEVLEQFNQGKLDATTEELESPAEESESPAEELESPAEELESPAEELESPAEELESPAEELESPAEELESPAEELESPAEELESQ